MIKKYQFVLFKKPIDFVYGFLMLFDSIPFLLIPLKCSGIQLTVCSLLGDQVFVVTTLDDTSVIQNHDGLTVSDG